MSDMQIIDHDESIMKVHRENATWLGVVDIKDHAPVTLIIKRVFKYKNGKFEGGRTQNGQAIEFEKTQKYLPLNATNTHELFKHGSKPSDFIGRQVVLDVVKLAREYMGSTHGIRIVGVKAAK